MMDEGARAKEILLLVEDDGDVREQMKWALKSDYTVLEASDRRTALAAVRRETPRLVLLDLGLPPDGDGASEGLAALRDIVQVASTMKVVVVTGNSDRKNALAAIEGGACDFIEKPVQLDVLKVILQRVAYVSGLEEENRQLLERATRNGFKDILGVSPAMQDIFGMIRRVATSDASVLITGESGTGKELVARAIHQQSLRNDGPFVPINCGAIPETLLESELFGHEKGSFTGASHQQKGKFEYAHGGTLFLDEIGELPLGLQVKLLRFLQDGRVERVGGRGSIDVDARVLAATNTDLKEAIGIGRFREDLFYRLNVIEIAVPPLRERGEDAVLLARALVSRFRSLNSRVTGLSAQAVEAIRAYAWPGNVRELENRSKRAVLLAEGPVIQPADLGLMGSNEKTTRPSLREARAKLERKLVQQALVAQNGNISRAAEDLGVSRQAVHDLIRKFGLEKVR